MRRTMDTNTPRFEFVRDDGKRRIYITSHQPLQADDLIAIVDRQVAENAWTYGTLYDLRTVREGTPLSAVRAVTEHVSGYMATLGHRGSVALVTRAVGMVAAGQVYASAGAKAGYQVEVFWDLDDAERWLDERRVTQQD